MRTSKDPLAPVRNWKELFFGDRRPRLKKSTRGSRRFADMNLVDADAAIAH